MKAQLTRRALFGAAFVTLAPSAATPAVAVGDALYNRLRSIHAAILSVNPQDYVRWIETGEGENPLQAALRAAERAP